MKTGSKWRLFLCGLCIGAADLVPGISGGTVALILGLYEPLLGVLHRFDTTMLKLLWRGRWRQAVRAVPWAFLLPLLAGIGVALCGFVHVIHYLLSEPTCRELLYASFGGLVLASAWLMVRRIGRWGWKRLLLAGVAGVAAFGVSGGRETAGGRGGDVAKYSVAVMAGRLPARAADAINYNMAVGRLTDLSAKEIATLYSKGVVSSQSAIYSGEGSSLFTASPVVATMTVGELLSQVQEKRSLLDLWVVFCGIVGISAALLPGISGSYCLNVLGMYAPVIAALADVGAALSRGAIAWEALHLLATLAFGLAVGGIVFARVVSWALRRYHDLTLAVMVGFMVGALRSIWPFWSTAYRLDPLHWERGPQLLLTQPLLPDPASATVWVAVACACGAFAVVLMLERYAQSSMGRVFSKTFCVQ